MSGRVTALVTRTHRGALGLVAFVWALASCGCLVSRAQYQECLTDSEKVRADALSKHRDDAAKIQDLEPKLAAAEAATQERDAKLSELSTANHNLQAQLDEATAMNQQLRGELSRVGQDVDKMLADRGTLAKALDDAKARLDELRKAQAAAEDRARLFRDFAQRFKSLIDAGQLRVESRRGRLVMNVSGDLLFDEGKAEIRAAGKGALMEIARALEATAPAKSGKRFAVTAHVDAEPAKSHHFKSSWELTTARAVALVEYFVSLRVPADSLTAAGAGAFDPLAPGDSAEGRAKNRRVEIALLGAAEETVVVASHP
jgi:chemotaxis protein MotB